MSASTPLMKQYNELKEKYANEILFFRLGDFFEMFYNDAIIASKVLGLTLTKRNKEKGVDVPMCGFPHMHVNTYVNKLVSNGYKVAICDQVVDPNNSKGIMTREVVKVVTPGTVIDIENLEANNNNFIASIFVEQNKAYVSYIDITTSVFNACIVELDKISSLIYMLDFKELVLTKQSYLKLKDILDVLDISISYVEKSKNSVEFLSEYFEISSLDSFGLTDKILIDVCSTLLEYILETQVKINLNITKISVINNENYADININTAKNLELFKNQRDKTSYGTLLWVLDKCKTSMGSRKLKQFLNYPLMDVEKINKRYDDVQYLIDNPLLKEELKEALENVFDLERILSKIVFGTQNAKDLRALEQTFVSYLKIYSLWEDKFKSIDVGVLNNLIDEINRYIVADPPISVRDGKMINIDFNDDTKELNEIINHGREYILNIEQELKEKTGIKTLKIGYNKIFGYYIEISKSNIKDVPDYFIRRQTLANNERYVTEELKVYEDKIINAKSKLLDLEYNLLQEVSQIIKEKKDILQQISSIVAYIDVITNFANISLNNRYIRPEFNDEGTIDIKDARHPVVENLIQMPFIENNISFTKDKNFVILTGPNMAGKSTYMKQIALICIMAQMGMYVPASYANICIIDKFLTRIGASDDIITGQSTFMLEMSEVSNIINNATKNSLIILDEVGRGTSTYDGLALASSISTYIHDKIGAKTIFATHYHELNELEQNYDRIVNYRIDVQEKNGKVIFLRTISRGAADKSYGNYVAKLAGLPQEILKNSAALLNALQKRHNLIQNNREIGQLSLFDNVTYNEEPSVDYEKQYLDLKDKIKSIEINNITPIEALVKLNELKDNIGDE